MLSDLRIKSYRCFQELEVAPLGRVNLFVGANGSGKTTILEAVQIISQATPDVLWCSPMRREETFRLKHDRTSVAARVTHLFHHHWRQMGVAFSIEASTQLNPSFVRCKVVEAPAMQNRLAALAMRFESHAVEGKMMLPLFDWGLPLADQAQWTPPDHPTVRFVPSGPMNVEQLGEIWDEIVLTSMEGEIAQALRVVEPRLQRIAFVGEDGGRQVYASLDYDGQTVSRERYQRIPVGSLGDGFMRLLALALHLVAARGGVLIVDDLDTGLHYSVMRPTWDLLLGLSNQLRVQIFATTHSLECVQALGTALEHDRGHREDVVLHRVERGRDSTVVFNGAEIARAAEHDLEVR